MAWCLTEAFSTGTLMTHKSQIILQEHKNLESSLRAWVGVCWNNWQRYL